MLFGAAEKKEGEREDGDDFEAGEGPLVTEVITERVLDGVRWRSEENAQLIRKAGHQAARGVRGQFVQMYRNDAPGALYSHLHKDGGDGDGNQRVAESPERNDDEAKAERAHHAAATSSDLRKVPEDYCANDGADVVEDGDVGTLQGQSVVDFLKEIGEEILRAVGEEHHEGHQEN